MRMLLAVLMLPVVLLSLKKKAVVSNVLFSLYRSSVPCSKSCNGFLDFGGLCVCNPELKLLFLNHSFNLV